MNLFTPNTTADADEVNANFDELDARLDTLDAGVFQEIARTTLTSSADSITVSDIPAKQYLQFIVTLIPTGGNINTTFKFNGDTGSNYGYAIFNAGSYSTATSQGSLPADNVSPASLLQVRYDVTNIASSEKMVNGDGVSSSATGAGTAPTALTLHGKWANTSEQIDEIIFTNAGTGSFASGSEVIVMGLD